MNVKKTADGKFDSIDLQTKTILVPDRRHVYLLHDGSSLFTHQHHKFALNNGMLTIVSTADTGQAAEAIKSLASAWVSFLQIGVIGQTLPAAAPSKSSPPEKSQKSLVVQNLLDRSAILRQNYPQLLLLKNVSPLVRSINDYKPDVWSDSNKQASSTQEEQQQMLMDEAPSGAALLLPEGTKSTCLKFGYFVLQVNTTPTNKKTSHKTSNKTNPSTTNKTSDRTDSSTTNKTNYETTNKSDGNTNDKVSKSKAPKTRRKPRSGIYVKVPVAEVVNSTLTLERRGVYLHRLLADDSEMGPLAATLQKGKGSESVWNQKLADANAHIAAVNQKLSSLRDALLSVATDNNFKHINGNISALEKQLADYSTKSVDWQNKIDTYNAAQKRLANVTHDAEVNLVLLYRIADGAAKTEKLTVLRDTVFSESTTATVPSEYCVNVPIDNALLGQTTFNLALTNGVLVEYSMDRPSSTLEALKLPGDVAQGLVGLLTQLVQFKINMLGQQKAYTDAKIAAQTSQYNLSQVKTQERMQSLQNEINYRNQMLTLQAENLKAAEAVRDQIRNDQSAGVLAAANLQQQLADLDKTISGDMEAVAENKKKIADLQSQLTGANGP